MAQPFQIKLEGEKKMLEAIQQIARKFPSVAKKALYTQAERIMSVSKDKYVPVDDSPLKNSGHVVSVRDKLAVELRYGGVSAPYALAVHEHPSDHSPRSWKAAEAQGRPVQFHPPGRGPQYLKRPMDEAVKTLARDLAGIIKLEKP